MELSNLSVIYTDQLEDILAEDNSPSRQIEVLRAKYASAPTHGSPDPVEQWDITFSARTTDPAIVVSITASRPERLAYLTKEIESRLEPIGPAEHWLSRWLMHGEPGEFRPFELLVMMIPVLTAIGTTIWIGRQSVELSTEFAESLTRMENSLDMAGTLARYFAERAALETRRGVILFSSLALMVVFLFARTVISPMTRISPFRHFLINDYLRAYSRRKVWQNQFFWTVMVGFLVSLLASVVILLLAT